jgi:divalent metal cation (Fe/Co/Zn/Cd) transporter
MEATHVERLRSDLVYRAFVLEWLTLGWVLVEAAAGIASGIQAHSVSLLAFGTDGAIEAASASLLLWRLNVELQHGRHVSEAAERHASRIGGGLLFALAAYVVIAAAWSLWTGRGEEFSVLGTMITAATIPAMYLLSRQKLEIAGRIGSRALRADAMESITCGWLSLIVLIGLLVQLVTGAWWVDAITSLGIVWFLIKEGREAWKGEPCCDHD